MAGGGPSIVAIYRGGEGEIGVGDEGGRGEEGEEEGESEREERTDYERVGARMDACGDVSRCCMFIYYISHT